MTLAKLLDFFDLHLQAGGDNSVTNRIMRLQGDELSEIIFTRRMSCGTYNVPHLNKCVCVGVLWQLQLFRRDDLCGMWSSPDKGLGISGPSFITLFPAAVT